MDEFNAFESQATIQVDWAYALKAVEGLDVSAASEGRVAIQGKAAIRILGEYGAIASLCAFSPKTIKLAIVICPPYVWFCPSKDGLSGVFIEPHRPDRHGGGIRFVKEADLFAYTNIDARLDAWNFYAQMLLASATPESPN